MSTSAEPVRLVRRKDRRRRVSVATIMALSFGLLVSLSVGGVLTLAVGANYTNTFDLLGSRSALLIDAMEDALRAHMGRAEDAVDGIAGLYAKGAFEIDDAGAMDAVLSGTLAGVPGASGMLVYTPDNAVRGILRGDGKGVEGFRKIDPNPETSPEILAAMVERARTDGRQWGSFVTSDSIVYANVSKPLIRDGARRGWIIAPIELATLSSITRDLSARFVTHAFILDGVDRVLADERLVDPKQAGKNAKPLGAIAEFGDPVIAGFARRQPFGALESARLRNVEVSQIELDARNADARGGSGGGDRAFIAITRTIPGYGARPWTLGAYYDRVDVSDEIYRAWSSGALGLLTLLAAVIVAILLGKWLARPVRAIADQAQRVAAFDIEDIRPLPRSRVLELDDQAVAFNAMTTGLRAFSTYIPRSLVAKLVRTGDSEITQPREAVLTVMFTDIAGFTGLSEQMEAGAAADILNHHFAILCQAIDAHGGTVDKFLGDGMMAFFGAPDRLKGHGAAAVRAASAIREAMASDNRPALAQGRPALKVRIGIHTGRVIVGNIGAADRVNYTIVGDTVNVSQRLQELGKQVAPDAETAIVVSDETAERLDDRFELVSAGRHKLRGRDEPIAVYLVGEVADAAQNAAPAERGAA